MSDSEVAVVPVPKKKIRKTVIKEEDKQEVKEIKQEQQEEQQENKQKEVTNDEKQTPTPVQEQTPVPVASATKIKKVVVKTPGFDGSTVKVITSTSYVKKPRVKKDHIPEEEKAKKVINMTPARMETKGISIGPARVRNTLSRCFMNKDIYSACEAITEASIGKVVKGKDISFAKTPINRLPDHIRNINNTAETMYINELTEKYNKQECEYMKSEKEKYEAYTSLKRDVNESIEDFNKRFDPLFYNKFTDFIQANDKLIIGLKVQRKGKTSEKIVDEYYRSKSLIKKMAIRMSHNSGYILSSFLDQLVMQLCMNAVNNCIEDDLKQVTISHAIQETKNNVSLYPLINTLGTYRKAIEWSKACLAVQAQADEIRKEKEKMKKTKPDEHTCIKIQLPDYPAPKQDISFDIYMSDVFRAAKLNIAMSKDSQIEIDKYASTSLTSNLKSLLNYIVYEVIERISLILKKIIERGEMRTVTNENMYHAIDILLTSCGINSNDFIKECKTKVAKYESWIENNQNNDKKIRTITKHDEVSEDEESREEDSEDQDESS